MCAPDPVAGLWTDPRSGPQVTAGLLLWGRSRGSAKCTRGTPTPLDCLHRHWQHMHQPYTSRNTADAKSMKIRWEKLCWNLFVKHFSLSRCLSYNHRAEEYRPFSVVMYNPFLNEIELYRVRKTKRIFGYRRGTFKATITLSYFELSFHKFDVFIKNPTHYMCVFEGNYEMRNECFNERLQYKADHSS